MCTDFDRTLHVSSATRHSRRTNSRTSKPDYAPDRLRRGLNTTTCPARPGGGTCSRITRRHRQGSWGLVADPAPTDQTSSLSARFSGVPGSVAGPGVAAIAADCDGLAAPIMVYINVFRHVIWIIYVIHIPTKVAPYLCAPADLRQLPQCEAATAEGGAGGTHVKG